jgi:hypothetical protein
MSQNYTNITIDNDDVPPPPPAPPAAPRRLSVAAVRDDNGQAHLAIQNPDGSLTLYHPQQSNEDGSYQPSMFSFCSHFVPNFPLLFNPNLPQNSKNLNLFTSSHSNPFFLFIV